MQKKAGWLLLALSLVFMAACGSAQTGGAPGKQSNGTSQTAGAPEKSEKKSDDAKSAVKDQPKPLQKVKIGYDGFSMSSGPINYAFQKGIFKKYGLDAELIFVNGGSTLTQALVGGSVDLAQNGYLPAAESIVSGADLVFIGGIAHKFPFQMVVKGDIKTPEQLKGKKIAISKFGSATDQAAQMALESIGLKKSDVAILQLGGSGQRVAADLSGQVDGSIEQYPQTGELLKKGFRIMVDVTDIAGEYPNTSFAARRDYVKKNPEIVKNFIKAISEGIHEYKKDKKGAVEITAKFLKIDNPKDLEDTYDFYTSKVYPNIPKPTLKGIQTILDDIAKKKPEANKIKPEQIVDMTAFDQLEKEKFFDKLK